MLSSLQLLSHVRLFVTPWIAARQASLSITNSWTLLKLMSIELVMPSNHLILCRPLLHPAPIFPSIRSFLMSQFFTSGGQSIGVSASASGGQSIGVSASVSVLPMNIQDWFPLGWTGCISLLSKGLSRVFSNQINFWIDSKASIVLCSASFIVQLSHPSIHDYWKNHSFD